MMIIEPFFDPATNTNTYVVFDRVTRDAFVVDPVLDYDPLSSQTALTSLEKIVRFVEAEKLTLHWILETHAHADHLSGSQYLREHFGARVAIGRRITEVQSIFRDVFALGPSFPVDGNQFDRLLDDGDYVNAGSLEVRAIATPGHTPACMTYWVRDAIFTGDALFTEDYGTGRCDFPGGSAEDLYSSIHDRLYLLAEDTRVFAGHDYQPGGRSWKCETRIGTSKHNNVQLRVGTTRDEFVRLRKARDKVLSQPRLLFQSIQVNINGGRLPHEDEKGRRFLKVPINLKGPTDDAGLRRGQ